MPIQPTTSQISASATTSNTGQSVVLQQTGHVSLTVNSQLMANISMNGLSLQSQLTLQQSQLLQQQQLIGVIFQQQLALFPQSAVQTSAIPITALQLQQLQNMLKIGTDKLPAQILQLLTESWGDTSLPSKIQLLKVWLNNQMLQLEWVSQQPILELKLSGNNAKEQDGESIVKILQWLIPLALQDEDDAIVLIEHQEQNNDDEDDNHIAFTMSFDLNRLGRLKIDVELRDFELVTKAHIERKELMQRFNHHWPQLEERLVGLGFECANRVIQMSTEPDDVPQRHSGLINIKV